MNPEEEEWEDYEAHFDKPHDPYDKATWTVSRPFAPAWSRWIVRTIEGEAESEKIFYSQSDAQALCERHLGEGKCAYIVEQEGEDIPF